MKNLIKDCFQKNGGILKLIPVFVPRLFGSAGRRLRLHPDDYFAYGTARGSIKERWFSSVISASNGPLAAPDEGMSYVDVTGRVEDKISFKDFVEGLGAELIGGQLFKKHGTWPMYSKFFDYDAALFHHVHLGFEAAAMVGKIGKPESYFYPVQMNNYPGKFPHTYFGFDPDVTKEQVKERLANYTEGDTRITELSRAYRIELGTGWYTPPGVIHAPGSYLTYEPQWNADVNSVYENIADGEIYNRDFLVENCPDDEKDNLDYVISLLDWDKNIDPNYKKHYFRPPVLAREEKAFRETWIAYGNPYISAKELTVYPGQEAVIRDNFAYDCVLVQGHGSIGSYQCETATMLRFGQLSADEFFVSEGVAGKGVLIKNQSQWEPLVMLKHFPSNAETPKVD